MQGQQPSYLVHSHGNRPGGHVREPVPRLLGVGGLDAHDEGGGRQDAQTEGHHQGASGGGEMHVGQLVAPPVDAEGAHVENVRTLHHDRARGSAEVDGVHDEQDVDAGHQLLDQVDPTDADLEHSHSRRQRLCEQRLRNGRSDAVVRPEHVAEAGHDGDHGARVGAAVVQSEQDVLVERLTRYPVDRYPVQHATTQFHLGSVLLHAGANDQALESLTAAREVFAGAGMRLEQAKATMMLGIAQRGAGRLEEATQAFADAEAHLETLDQPAEQAAAAYNLGLVHHDSADIEAAHAAWTRAQELFLTAGYPAQAGAAARDHGGSLLAAGQVAESLPLLEQALTLAELAADAAGTGAAANALGLAHLAAGDPTAAVSALRRALGEFPRSVSPADYAMVKANLALAHQQAGEPAPARLAARQALAVTGAAAPVRAQARQLLAPDPGCTHEDLLTVLDARDPAQWVAVIREEVVRVAESPPDALATLVRGFLDGLLERPGASYDLAESLLHVVLELPPATYGLLVSAVVNSCSHRPAEEVDRLHSVLGSAMARFAMPQWQRLAASLNAAAEVAGEPATWR